MIERSVSMDSLGDRLQGRLFVPDDQPGSEQSTLPAVLFCHGATDYKEHFFDFCRFLTAQGYVTLALDMHGHGESEGVRYHVSMDYWCEDVRSAIDYLGALAYVDAERIAGFGFSSGGTAVLTAALAGVSFKTLILLDATVRNVVSDIEARLLKMAGRFGSWKRLRFGTDLHLPLYPLALINPLTHNALISRAFMKEDYFKQAFYRYPLPGALESLVVDLLPRLSAIQIPTCVLHGEEDRLDSPETAKLIFQALSGDKALHIIPENGHMGHLDINKDKVMQLTLDWLEKQL